MNNRGFIHIVLPVTILLISAVLVGVSIYYKANKETSQTATPTVSQRANTPVITNTLTNSSTNTNVSNANTSDIVDTTDSTNATTDMIDPTTGWETYTNEQSRFSFLHPPGWSIVEDTTTVPGQVIYVAEDPTDAEGRFSVAPGGYPGSGAPEGESIVEDIEFGEVSGVQRTLTLANGTIWASYVDLENPPVGWETAHPIDLKVGTSNSLSTLNQILSTFRFTDADPTAGWETYTHVTHGFSFQYPPDMSIARDTLSAPGTVGTVHDSLLLDGTTLDFEMWADVGFGPPSSDQSWQIEIRDQRFVITSETVNNPAEQVIGGNNPETTSIHVSMNGEPYYFFTFTTPNANWATDESVMREILDSFQFTE